MKNTITWFEIPATDLDRAIKFYNTVLNTPVQRHPDFPPFMAFFVGEEMNVGGSIVQHNEYTPTTNGVLIYFDVGDDMQAVLDRIEPNGGKILQGKTLITEEVGYMALFLDSEGNRIALHSQK
ncbi:MAG TPA: VOC family protein [Caldithrix abyssi]|uniref:VOC family protein n=1 Tax=Caldithrix abyssi TaxID=187145 RepID=A0A7V4WVM8_CALAY|nr:VOC family protein [Caldithrix abyssi]